MHYVISDLHGCYEKYKAMLNQIKFSDTDDLYVLGDVVDRGEQPFKILRDMSLRPNVFPIMGNHDYMALILLKRLMVEITEDNYETHLDANVLEGLSLWLSDGGQTTLDEFRGLRRDVQQDMLLYLSEFSAYELLTLNKNAFVLVHAGLPEQYASKDLDDFEFFDFVSASTDYEKRYFKDAYLVTGHTPTFLIDEQYRGRVYKKNNHIAIDTGAVFGENLCCVCLETGEVYYV